jgi:eukaryotic-like serine/threonine-protein kinase
MHSGQSSLLQLAEAVADGNQVDWDHAESSAQSNEERRVVQQLRRLAAVSQASRALLVSWGPLELRQEIGHGTFGTVYRAWDSKLEREVALKLVEGGQITEGQLLARIRHPNVVTVYGADVFDGRAGIWMEFITGDTLKTVVDQKGRLGAAEAALIGRDLCGALAAVHAAGLLHRDIKAQNVMREAGGRTVLMDFGAGGGAGAELPLAGTPAYLAPELLHGAPPSVLSDFYALGILLFYLVSGTFPVASASLQEFREAHASGRRRSLRDLRPDLPREFIRVVDLLISPAPADRPGSAGEVERFLEMSLGMSDRGIPAARPSKVWGSTAMAAAVAASVAVVLLAGVWGTQWNRSTRTQRNSVAILPFTNLTPNAARDDYLTEGLTADLSAQLSGVKDLRVIAGTSTRRYRDEARSERDVGIELGVAAVLDGTVRQDGNRIRIVSTLTDTQSGEQLWSESFERGVTDIFAVQAEVARRIAVALKGELADPDVAALRAGTTRDFETVRLYAKGRYYASLRTEDGLHRSLELFQAALARDSSYAAAHAGLAEAYTSLGTYGFLPRAEAFARAASEGRRAVSIDESVAEAHAALGYVLKNQFEFPGAEASFKRAIELKPSWSTGHHWYSILLTQQGRFAEAITESRQAISLDPLAIAPNLQLAAALLMGRRYDDAVTQYQRALQIEPAIASAYRSMGLARTYQRQFDAAASLFEQAKRATPPGAEDQELKSALGYLHAKSGRRAEALGIARELAERFTSAGEEVAANVAAIHAGLGDRKQTFEWLRRAVVRRDPELGYMKVDPRWDELRGDDEFKALLAKLRL